MEALSRAFRILECFRDGDGTRTVEEIASTTQIPLSTTYRYVAALVRTGFLTHSPRRPDALVLGTSLLELLAGSDPNRHLRRVARPHLVDLQRVTGHHSQLAVLEGANVVYVEKLSATRAVLNITDVGRRMPAVINSAGILLLAERGIHEAEAALDTAEVEAFVAGLPDYAAVQVPTPEGLRASAMAARRKGYCELDSWLAPGITGISAPVRNAAGEAVAAVSVIMPNDREAVRRVVPVLRFTGITISRALSQSARPSEGPGAAGPTSTTHSRPGEGASP